MSYQPKSQRKLFATGLTAAMVASAVAPVAVSADTHEGFPDVPKDHHYTEAINTLAAMDVINGYDDGEFKMGNTIKREEAAQMLYKILELSDDASAAPFDDVQQGVWYSPAVNALYEADIINGQTETTFGTNLNITRAEIAQLLVEAYDIPTESVDHPFDDVEDDAWYAEAIETLYANELISGTTKTTFDPKEDMERGDFAWLLYNVEEAFGKDPELTVESVSAIDATTIEVTWSNGETQEVELDEALVDGENEVTFTVDGVEYTETVTFELTDLEVSSVSAVTEKIEAGDDEQQLKVQVNGNQEVSVAKLEEFGYEVEFLYSEDNDALGEDGVVDASEFAHGDSFDYQVVLTDEDDNEVKSDRTTVTAYDVDTVVEVTEVSLFEDVNDEDSKWENDYVTEGGNEGDLLAPVTGVNAFGEEIKLDWEDDNSGSFPGIESVTSSDITVAYYDEAGLQVVGEGSVTFTVEFENDTEITYSTEVVANEEITSIKEDGTGERFTINDEDAISSNLNVSVLDQYGNTWEGNENVNFTVKDSDGEVVGSGTDAIEEGEVAVDFASLVNESGERTVTEPGSYTVEFENDGDALGKVAVELVELEIDSVDEFTLESDPESVDLYDTENGEIYEDGNPDIAGVQNEETEFEITVDAMFDGVELSDSDLTAALEDLEGDLRFNTSNEEVVNLDGTLNDDTSSIAYDNLSDFTFEATAGEEGTATLALEQVEGDFVTTIATVEVTVENSTPQVTTLTLADDAETLELVDGDIVDYTQLTSPDVEEVTEDMVAEVIYSENDEKVIVTFEDVYGGESFVFNAENEVSVTSAE